MGEPLLQEPIPARSQQQITFIDASVCSSALRSVPDPLTSFGDGELGWGRVVVAFNVCGVNTVQGECEPGERGHVSACVNSEQLPGEALETSPSPGRTWLHWGGVATLAQLCSIPHGVGRLWTLS